MSIYEAQPSEVDVHSERPRLEQWEIEKGRKVAKTIIELVAQSVQREPVMRGGIQYNQIVETLDTYDYKDLLGALVLAQRALEEQPLQPELGYQAAA